MRSGRRVAFDIGKARIGVAVSDFHGILASPRDFISRDQDLDVTAIALNEFAENEEALEIYIGLPLNLNNQMTESTTDALQVARALVQRTQVPVLLIDERLTTRQASAEMSANGKSTRQQRGSIDSVSAALILESALQNERSFDVIPGTKVEDFLDE